MTHTLRAKFAAAIAEDAGCTPMQCVFVEAIALEASERGEHLDTKSDAYMFSLLNQYPSVEAIDQLFARTLVRH